MLLSGSTVGSQRVMQANMHKDVHVCVCVCACINMQSMRETEKWKEDRRTDKVCSIFKCNSASAVFFFVVLLLLLLLSFFTKKGPSHSNLAHCLHPLYGAFHPRLLITYL